MGRPDFSDYVVHFTSDRPPLGIDHPNNKDDERLREIARLNAKQRLTLILRDRYIRTTPTPWLNVPACCFIECTWPSLMDNAHKYSPYAIGFSKKYIFNKGGGPAIYMRPDVYLDQQNFVTSKAQGYAYSVRRVHGAVCAGVFREGVQAHLLEGPGRRRSHPRTRMAHAGGAGGFYER